MKEKTEKRTRFGVANLVWALVSFGIFMAVGLTGHYMAVGEFVTAELAGTYAILALVGAAAVLLRLWRFTLFFYLGCGLGWGAGWFVSGLKGDFAPGFFIKHFIKDMKIIHEESTARGVRLEMLESVLALYEKMAEMGLEDNGTQALIRYYREGKK